jgi:hypothetical protein
VLLNHLMRMIQLQYFTSAFLVSRYVQQEESQPCLHNGNPSSLWPLTIVIPSLRGKLVSEFAIVVVALVLKSIVYMLNHLLPGEIYALYDSDISERALKIPHQSTLRSKFPTRGSCQVSWNLVGTLYLFLRTNLQVI